MATAGKNVDLVRRAAGSFPANLDEMLSFMAPEIELRSAIVGGVEGATYRGHDGVREWYTDVFGSFESLENEWLEFRDLGDRVLAFGRVRARGRESGLELDSEMGWVLTLSDGMLLRAEGFLDREDALAAAGLTE